MNDLNPASWINQKSIVGNNSAGKLTTNTNSHIVLNPTWFQSPFIYDGPNSYRGTSCNRVAAQGKFFK